MTLKVILCYAAINHYKKKKFFLKFNFARTSYTFALQKSLKKGYTRFIKRKLDIMTTIEGQILTQILLQSFKIIH